MCNWIRPKTRLAIYMRDGLACVYCGRGLEDGILLTLDHVKPKGKHGMNNAASNLVTACKECNDRKNHKPLSRWIRRVSVDTRQNPKNILARVVERQTMPMREYLEDAKYALLARKCKDIHDVRNQYREFFARTLKEIGSK